MVKRTEKAETLNKQQAPGIPFDEYSFIVEIDKDSTDLPPGSLCVFRGGEIREKEGDLVLVQTLSFPDLPSYSIKRFSLENKGAGTNSSARPAPWSGETPTETTRQGEVIVGRFICVLD